MIMLSLFITGVLKLDTPTNSCPLYCFLLRLLSGDIEENPGPLSTSSTTSDCFSDSLSSLINSGLSGMHLNIQSLRPKLDILTIESQPYDRALVEPYCQRRRSSDSQFMPSLQTR